MDKTGTLKREPIGGGKYIYVSKEHTFGTDAILLANFSHAKTNDVSVDLGTGCGIIPFLLIKDSKLKSAEGVDISEAAIEIANKTAKEQGFDNFSGIVADITDLKGKISFGNKTLVTCNPPYKAAGGGIKARESARLTARQETSCTLEDIISVSAKLLTPSGRLCMCQRPERLGEIITLMSKYKVEAKRLRLVAKEVGSAPWLVLIEGRRSGKPGMVIEPTLYLYENGELTEEMINIYGDYKEAYL
ncbi:MAG: methyltransferase [Clostridia bacterium]|nr:methyltransferase [Clostridia bacterium]